MFLHQQYQYLHIFFSPHCSWQGTGWSSLGRWRARGASSTSTNRTTPPSSNGWRRWVSSTTRTRAYSWGMSSFAEPRLNFRETSGKARPKSQKSMTSIEKLGNYKAQNIHIYNISIYRYRLYKPCFFSLRKLVQEFWKFPWTFLTHRSKTPISHLKGSRKL